MFVLCSVVIMWFEAIYRPIAHCRRYVAVRYPWSFLEEEPSTVEYVFLSAVIYYVDSSLSTAWSQSALQILSARSEIGFIILVRVCVKRCLSWTSDGSRFRSSWLRHLMHERVIRSYIRWGRFWSLWVFDELFLSESVRQISVEKGEITCADFWSWTYVTVVAVF